jgi:hypothetical protein
MTTDRPTIAELKVLWAADIVRAQATNQSHIKWLAVLLDERPVIALKQLPSVMGKVASA